jgi:predicted RecB family nuclease
MDNLENNSALALTEGRTTTITSRLFSSYLACPTKCYLQATGETGRDNEFSSWLENLKRSYEHTGIQRLSAIHGSELGRDVPNVGALKGVSWRFAPNLIVRVQNLESELHIQRIPPKTTKDSSQFVPIRFVPLNKLSRFDSLLAGFDAVVLSKASGLRIDLAQIIHGDSWSVTKVKANALTRKIHQVTGKIDSVLLGGTPPPPVLNRHCSECEFQSRCRKLAIEKDELSLLANLPDKERSKLNRRGIFTVCQLSYTFRPRRRFKRLAAKPEKYHHSLQALAIREQKIHVIGNPSFQFEGTPVFVDVEGIPDRDFYYLIGLRFEIDGHPKCHSFWADSSADEEHIWKGFLDVLSTIANPTFVHYGSFEATFIKKDVCSIRLSARKFCL